MVDASDTVETCASEDAEGVGEDVRRFYERHPYPPPLDDLDGYRQRLDRQWRRADAHLLWPTDAYREDRTVLVAGCGTSQAAKYALRWPRARVTGIDTSEASLRHTDTLRRKHKLENLELCRLRVERATELGRTFEHVVCTGVLHHLADPDLGLRALKDVLHPRGAMHLMVYAPYGRSGIYLLQNYCRTLGIGSSPREIRDLAASLRGLPADHPLMPLLRRAADFRQETALADALLHPHDRPYSVPQFLDFIARNGLRFGRWVRQAPYLPWCGAMAASPHRALCEKLPAEDQFAAAELFRGTMVRHSAIVYRSDCPEPVQPLPVRFDPGRWPDYVPLPVPGTHCVRDRLPAGAAAVLVNPGHTDRDLYLPLDAREACLFAAIDGIRTVGTIVRNHGHPDLARDLFERLWHYDQIVFDASAVNVSNPAE